MRLVSVGGFYLGPLGDHYGPKAGVVVSFSMTLVGTLIPSATLNYSAVGFALVLCGLGTKGFARRSFSFFVSRGWLSMISPLYSFIGPFGDHYGPKAGVVASFAMTLVGTAVASATLNYSAVGFGLVLCGLGMGAPLCASLL